jgi:CBS domain-containing protein
MPAEPVAAATVGEIMRRDPEAVGADMTISEAARRMGAVGTGDVIVLDGDRLAGILTDRDIVTGISATGGRTPPKELLEALPARPVRPAAQVVPTGGEDIEHQSERVPRICHSL